MGMTTITEAELVDNAKNRAVKCIKAVPVDSGKGFHLSVQLTWKEGDLILVTQKKSPRVWASADRMLAHIQQNYRPIVMLTIFLEGTYDESS
jgi:hypothetical protein